MKRYTVQIARIEHKIYEFEVDAENIEAAENIAMEEWESEGDLLFTDLGCVHGEEFVHDVKLSKEAA
jgi:hypothetical protein